MRLDPKRAPLVALAGDGLQILLKGIGALMTGSLALGAAALDSFIDLFISIASYWVMRRSAAPPDAEHAYGHGRFENLAALGQGAFLIAAAGGLVVAGSRRLSSGRIPHETGLGVAILAASFAINLLVIRYLSRAARQVESPALKAESRHYLADLSVTGAAGAALLIVRWSGQPRADPLVALAVAAYVLWESISLIREALGDLSDRGLPEVELQRIQAVVASFAPDAVGLHDLRTRRSGAERFIELHLEIPRHTSFVDAHALIVRVLRAIQRELPRSKVFIHGDPV